MSGRLESRKAEKGQSAALVAVMLVVMLGMLALALDGGNVYFKRREAQNAADAGAMAGAREWCTTHNATSATNRANEYAMTRDGANQTVVVVNSGRVTVTAMITVQTSIASILGMQQMVAAGKASSGCFVPSSGTGVLPAAWACPVVTDPSTGQQRCNITYNYPVVVMDSVKTGADFKCQNPPNSGTPAGALDCDVNGDGVNDYIAGGNRSWLDLDGSGGGASSLVNWINGGFAGTINYHTWFGGQQGTSDSVFQAVANRVGQTFVVPVFNKYCNQNGLPQSVCPSQWDGQDTVVGSNGNILYYHIITFALFHVSCVDKGGQVVKEAGVTLVKGKCPTEDALTTAGLLPKSDKTIEGYFVQGVVPGLGGQPGDGVDGGAWAVFLTL